MAEVECAGRLEAAAAAVAVFDGIVGRVVRLVGVFADSGDEGWFGCDEPPCANSPRACRSPELGSGDDKDEPENCSCRVKGLGVSPRAVAPTVIGLGVCT